MAALSVGAPEPGGRRCDPEAAEPWVERAADERSPWIGFMKVDPRVDALCGRPGIESLISRVGQSE